MAVKLTDSAVDVCLFTGQTCLVLASGKTDKRARLTSLGQSCFLRNATKKVLDWYVKIIYFAVIVSNETEES